MRVVSKNTNALKTHVPERRVRACHAFRVRLPHMDRVHGAGPSTFGPSGALCLCRGVRLRLPVRVRRDRDAGSWCRSAHRPSWSTNEIRRPASAERRAREHCAMSHLKELGRSLLGRVATFRDPPSAQQHPKPAVDIREPRPFHGTAEDGELLPKSDILESQLATSLEGRDESANQRRNHAGMVPADRRLIKFGAHG